MRVRYILKVKKYGLLLLLILTLSGCNKNKATDIPFEITSIPSANQTDQTPYTQISTLSPNLSPTPKNLEYEIETFLQTNRNCNLPCFWGIYPEATNYTQVESFFYGLGKEGFVSNEGDHTYMSTTFAFKENGRVYLKLDIQNSVVQNIEATLDGLWNREIELKDWSAYNLDEVLRVYGPPTSIELYLDLPNNLILYSIKLTYKNLDATILYGGSKSDEGDRPSSQVTVCPGREISSVKMSLGKNPINPEPSGTSLSMATTLNVNDFHQLYIEDPGTCFDLNISALK